VAYPILGPIKSGIFFAAKERQCSPCSPKYLVRMVPPWRRQNLDLRGDGDIKKAFLYNMVCIYIYIHWLIHLSVYLFIVIFVLIYVWHTILIIYGCVWKLGTLALNSWKSYHSHTYNAKFSGHLGVYSTFSDKPKSLFRFVRRVKHWQLGTFEAVLGFGVWHAITPIISYHCVSVRS